MMKIDCKDSQFKPGTTLKVVPDLHLKRLSFDHCEELKSGERIWLRDLPDQDFILAVCVNAIVQEAGRTVVHYTSPHRIGRISVYPKKGTCFYKLLDEDSLLQPEAQPAAIQLRSV